MLTVEDPATARLLVDAGRARFLGPFLAREASAGDAARMLGVGIDQVLARLRRFLAAGLVEVVRTQRRAGRPIKVYRCVADEFFVPLALLDLENDALRSEDRWHAQFRRSLEAVLVEQLGGHEQPGARISMRGGHGPVVQAAVAPGTAYDEQAPNAPAVVYHWGALRLAPADAKELQAELYALLARYEERTAGDQPQYVVGACMAPWSDGT